MGRGVRALHAAGVGPREAGNRGCVHKECSRVEGRDLPLPPRRASPSVRSGRWVGKHAGRNTCRRMHACMLNGHVCPH